MAKKTKVCRTLAEVDREYSEHAAQYGHKSHQIEKLHSDAERLMIEVAGHMAKLKELSRERVALPPIVAEPNLAEVA